MFYQEYRLAVDIWSAIYSILDGLDVNKESPYELGFNSSHFKICTILSFDSCVALDKVYFNTRGKLNRQTPYYWEKRTSL